MTRGGVFKTLSRRERVAEGRVREPLVRSDHSQQPSPRPSPRGRGGHSLGDSMRHRLTPWIVGAMVVVVFALSTLREPIEFEAVAQSPPRELDPAEWGDDHVGGAIPEFVSGDECLFCHRQDIGPTWSADPHATTIRAIEATAEVVRAFEGSPPLRPFAAEAEFMIGRENRVRLLKRLPAYGELALLSAGWKPATDQEPGQLVDASAPHWQEETFAQSCAGCHATAVEAGSGAFSARSLDCFVCHGDASLDHTKDASLVHLSRKRNDDARVVTSICAQCHVRTGKSRSTGRPYPNNFIAGDNLFRDFAVDFSDEHLKKLNPGDRHVLENVRDVVVRGEEAVTCLSCHSVHGDSSAGHHRVAQSERCATCHAPGVRRSRPIQYEVHSGVCRY